MRKSVLDLTISAHFCAFMRNFEPKMMPLRLLAHLERWNIMIQT